MKRQSKAPEAEILKWAARQKAPFGSNELVGKFGVSRQTAARSLKRLVESGKLVKSGSTQNARYGLARGRAVQPKQALTLKKKTKNLAEDQVFDEVSLRLGLESKLSENAFRIVNYAFCEMLNNAIDHSRSALATIDTEIARGQVLFRIRDTGVGVFNNIRRGFNLESEEQAVEHLLKGKQTTAPEAHSGQGLFFTSKIADSFELRSGKYRLTFDNEKKDLILSEMRPLKGTEVSFTIKSQTRRSLPALFAEYANDDFDFDRTSYPIVILKQGGVVSRSQARRLTMGLDKFDRIILDFAKVKEMGQGFADEMFRVFQSKNPGIVLEVRNASPAVNLMIRRVDEN